MAQDPLLPKDWWADPRPRNRAEAALPFLEEFYRDLNDAVAGLVAILGDRLRCGLGCHDCCVDDLTVFEIEAWNIRLHHEPLLEDGVPHPPGKCPLLGADGSCRVYQHRPYVCRTQGLPLRWLEEQGDGTAAELRDICPLNDHGTPLVELPEDHCWAIGPHEERLAGLQIGLGGSMFQRTSLRDLFG